MKTYRVSERDLDNMCEKLVAAQTLLNADAISITKGKGPLSDSHRVFLAEEAEELVDAVTSILHRIQSWQDGVQVAAY